VFSLPAAASAGAAPLRLSPLLPAPPPGRFEQRAHGFGLIPFEGRLAADPGVRIGVAFPGPAIGPRI
jgi:hypothetical protein